MGEGPDDVTLDGKVEDLERVRDCLPLLGGLRVPTLVLSDDRDFVPRDVVRRVAEAIPAARLHTLADCGHVAYMEQPELERDAIVELMARAPSGAEWPDAQHST